ncbi:hypothetical protein BpHYR1_006618 [Brachionus plicatilis]|uniref:Uncharacterized protein n=1 Tax=Brachionus plicatilis TaxID=10195 RepID=A0A3M7R8Q7_BRAPC|nr:hypothetical protein BpHYR1_006618 [Brachionus plicatilis]
MNSNCMCCANQEKIPLESSHENCLLRKIFDSPRKGLAAKMNRYLKFVCQKHSDHFRIQTHVKLNRHRLINLSTKARVPGFIHLLLTVWIRAYRGLNTLPNHTI